jgi:hypothetical protein
MLVLDHKSNCQCYATSITNIAKITFAIPNLAQYIMIA